MIKQEFLGASGIILPGAITIPKGEEIAISQDWLIFPEAITGEGKIWTIDGLLEPCIKQDNEVWVDSTVENPFAEPITYKGKNKYGWLVGEITADVTDELNYIDRKSVRNIILSNYVTEIPDQAFFDCYDLQNIIISNSVKRIGNIAFWNCGSIKNLIIPDTVVEMGGGVFSNCSALESIKLPNTLTQLYSYEYIYEDENHEILGFFQNCHNLLTIVLPLTLQNIDNFSFYNCSSLTSITIPNSVTSIGDDAFQSCSKMTSVTIGSGVTSIGSSAFYGCTSLTSVTIGESVTSIGNYAFYECPLQRIVSYAETPPVIEWSTFENVDRSIPLEVPNADLYREAPYWQEFYNILTINPYQLNISSNNEEWGTVRMLEHNTNRSIIEAIYKDGYAFKQWSDGDTNQWRELNITEDTTLVAEFGEPYQCEIVNLEIIDSTPTSVTVRFEVTCNEERDTLNHVQVCTNNCEFCGSVAYKPGILETIIEGLQPETMYNIKLEVMNDIGHWEERYIEFTTPSAPHSYVDLGLPSGTLWADRNIGADNPEDTGLLFQWGDTTGWKLELVGIDKVFDWDSYWDTPDSGNTFTKYTDRAQTLNIEDDAAYVNMGENWKTPGSDEINELLQHTTPIYVDINNIEYETEEELQTIELKGVKLLSKVNDSSIFIPLHEVECLWVAKLFNHSAQFADFWGIYRIPHKHFGYQNQNYRYEGYPIRGVTNIM